MEAAVSIADNGVGWGQSTIRDIDNKITIGETVTTGKNRRRYSQVCASFLYPSIQGGRIVMDLTDIGGTSGQLQSYLPSSVNLSGSYYTDELGYLRQVPSAAGTLPSDVTTNGDIYIAGATALPSGLSSNGGVIMTDGSIYFPGTYSNGGVLAVNPNATGA